MHIAKYHLTKRQGVILGALGTVLVAVFGPDSTGVIGVNGSTAHLQLGVFAPAIVGLLDALFHNITGVLPVKPIVPVVPLVPVTITPAAPMTDV